MIKVEDPRFRNLERKIGLFILVALTGIILVVALVGVQRGVFTKTYTLHFTVDRGTGFPRGCRSSCPVSESAGSPTWR